MDVEEERVEILGATTSPAAEEEVDEVDDADEDDPISGRVLDLTSLMDKGGGCGGGL